MKTLDEAEAVVGFAGVKPGSVICVRVCMLDGFPIESTDDNNGVLSRPGRCVRVARLYPDVAWIHEAVGTVVKVE